VALRRRTTCVALLTLAALGIVAAIAQGERSQHGTLIVALGGRLAPLSLPRTHAAPVAVELEGSLRTADGSPLPRVTRVEFGLPQQAVLSTDGLPTCTRRKLLVTSSADALRVCQDALVGRGHVDLTVQVPGQEPFAVHTRLLAFNARVGTRRAVLLHAYTASPPLAVVLPFVYGHGSGRFARTLGADLPVLGEWARVAEFKMALSRQYAYRGRRRSYLSASCPIPKRLTAGFFSFARVAYSLADGRQATAAIARSCRAR
jgi:hypothetical protein